MPHLDFQVPAFGEFDGSPQFVDGYARLVQAAGPIGYWRLGDADPAFAADDSGHGRHGEYPDSPQLLAPGLLAASPDPAAEFVHPDNAAVFPEFPGLTPGAALTLTFWMRKEADLTGGRLITYRDDAGDGFNLQFFGDATGVDVVFRVTRDGTAHADRTDTGLGIADHETHHIAAVFDDGAIAIFVDGQPMPMAGGIGGQIVGTDKLVVGPSLVGVLDELALFDHALTAADLAAHHEAGRIEEAA